MVMEVSLRQITVASEPERTFFLKVEWKEDFGAGFVVLLCDGSSAWTGEGIDHDLLCLPFSQMGCYTESTVCASNTH